MDKIQEFGSWEEVIKDFIYQREKGKIKSLLSKKESKKSDSDAKQAIIIQLAFALNKLDSVDKSVVKDIINRKNTGKNKLEDYTFKLNQYSDLLKITNHPSVSMVNDIYEEKKQKIQEFHRPSLWLNYYADKSGGVSFATHVAKITHSSIKGVPSFFVKHEDSNNGYITTSNMRKPIIDDAIDNAALTPIANLLKLEHDGVSLGSLIHEGDYSVFGTISDLKTAKEWVEGFSKVFAQKKPSAHFLQKQIFFPVCEVPKYHLLCNVKSSSLAHYIFEKNKYIKMDMSKYSQQIKESLINIAELNLTATAKAHTNVSPLHARRRGKIHLFSTQPPTWKKQLKPPIYKESLFDGLSNYQINEDMKYLVEFLQRFKQLDLSYKDLKRKVHLERWIESIVDELLYYANTIQKLPASWSAHENIRLKIEHQYFLDPYRDDEVFQAKRSTTDWQAIVRDDFANWVNRKLVVKDKTFTPQAEHTRLWKKLFAESLREDTEAIKAEKQFNAKQEAV